MSEPTVEKKVTDNDKSEPTATPNPSPPKVPSTEKKSTIQIPSIDSLKSKIKAKPEEKVDKEVSAEQNDRIQTESFSLKELDLQWQAFQALKKENGKDQERMLLKEPYELHENNIVLKLSNEVLKITFDQLKSDLQGFLRKNLNNRKIILEAEVIETVREDMIYTNKEKFAHLIKKYPDLKDLQDRLGLDPDY